MNRKLRAIMIIMAFTTLTNNMVHPVTPKLIADQGHGPAFLGLVFAAMAFANFAMSPVWGRLSDRYGRKPIMIAAPIGYGIAQIGFGYSMSPLAIIFFRLLAGMMASASFIGGMAYIVDVTDRYDRSKQLAFYTALTGFTGTLGYLLGGWVGNDDYHRAFILQSFFSFTLALTIILFLQESHTKDVREPKRDKTGPKQPIAWNMTVIVLLLSIFLTGIIYKGFDISFNAFLQYTLEVSPFQIGLAMAASGLIGLVTNFILYPMLKRRMNDFNLLLGTIVTMTVAALFFTLDLSPVTLIIAMAIFFACLALYKPLLQAILSKMGERNGEIMGWNNAANSIGLVIGSSVIGAIYEYHAPYAFYALSFIGILTVSLLMVKHKDIRPFVKEESDETTVTPNAHSSAQVERS